VEGILRTINDCLRTLLIHSATHATFWAEALNTVTFQINRRLCRATSKMTPHEVLLGTPPRYDELLVYACLCYPHICATMPTKLSPPPSWCVFLDYPTDHCGYRCLDLHSRRVIASRQIAFDENSFPFWEHITAPSPIYTTIVTTRPGKYRNIA
jgi:hypothetical protein